MQAGREVELAFPEVQVDCASFFNASLGFLLSDFEPQELNRLIQVSRLNQAALVVVREGACHLFGQGGPWVDRNLRPS